MLMGLWSGRVPSEMCPRCRDRCRSLVQVLIGVHERAGHGTERIPDLSSLDILLIGLALRGHDHLFDRTIEIWSV